MTLASPGTPGPSARRKRLLDLALVVATLPLWATAIGLLALSVLILDGRPVFFPQRRLGRHARPFTIWKLRTMTLESDPALRRPTRVGQHLRHHGIDELPQLYNVLRGEMSLVGPRPLVPEDVARLSASWPGFASRLSLAPGLTGLPQVCCARGVAETAALDLHYARRWTLRLDLIILVRTAWINLVGKRRGRWSLREPLPPTDGLA